MNIEGKRSGDGFVCHRETLVDGLSKTQSVIVEVIDRLIDRKGFLNYIRLLSGSNIVKIVPMGAGLKVVCGSNIGNLADRAWLTEKTKYGSLCQVRVSPHNTIIPNLGGIELAEALGKVIPFVSTDKTRPVLRCIRFAQKDGKLALISADGFRLAEINLDFEEGEGEVLIEALDLKGLLPAIRKAKRTRLSLNNGVHLETETASYKWQGEEGKYPDYEKVFPTDWVAQATVDAKAMLRAAVSISALSIDKQAPIVITIGESKIRLTPKDENEGEAEVEAETNGEAQIAISANYLTQALKAMGGMIELKVKDPRTAMLFSADGYRLLVLPIEIGLAKKDGERKPEAVAETEPVTEVAEIQAEAVAEAVAEAEAVVKEVAEAKPRRRQSRNKLEPVAV